MSSGQSGVDIEPVLDFLHCRTPDAWVEAACADLDTLLLDHASLELKAAQQALKLIRKYGAAASRDAHGLTDEFRGRLVHRMSRLAREELRHFEQVTARVTERGGSYIAISPASYAAGLHAIAATREPEALIDALLIGAVIEARSCERFFSLIEPLAIREPELSEFYASLLRAEARHFGDYLDLARSVAEAKATTRIDRFLERDAELMVTRDSKLRFLGGSPRSTNQPR